MNDFIARALLTQEELGEIHSLIKQAEWADTNKKIPEYLERCQTNQEMLDGPGRKQIHDIIFKALGRDREFMDLVSPDYSTYVTISRTEPGQGFKVHHDLHENGDFSTTVFLSDPDKYQGGRLQVLSQEGETEIALPAGHAITYSSGIPHCVSKVTKGVRYAAIFWTTSTVRDPRLREILWDIRLLKRSFPRYSGFNLKKATRDPEFILSGIENKLLRYMSQEKKLNK